MREMAGLCPMLLSPWNAPAAVYMYKSWVSASPRDLREEVQCFPGMVREVAKGGGHRFIMESRLWVCRCFRAMYARTRLTRALTEQAWGRESSY
jgi:hypothetical protein